MSTIVSLQSGSRYNKNADQVIGVFDSLYLAKFNEAWISRQMSHSPNTPIDIFAIET